MGWFFVDIDKQTEKTSNRLVYNIGQKDIEVKPGFTPKLLAHLVSTLITHYYKKS